MRAAVGRAVSSSDCATIINIPRGGIPAAVVQLDDRLAKAAIAVADKAAGHTLGIIIGAGDVAVVIDSLG